MRAPLTTITLIAALSAPAFAETQPPQPGDHFFEMWDLNEDGQVTQEEARERRGDIFYMFDSDEDGILSAEEYVNFDETRAIDMREHGLGQEKGQGNERGNNQRRTQGAGQGSGKGTGQGMGRVTGEHGAALSMERQNADLDGDGAVTRAEFLDGVANWFPHQDRNGDGVITRADFGRN